MSWLVRSDPKKCRSCGKVWESEAEARRCERYPIPLPMVPKGTELEDTIRGGIKTVKTIEVIWSPIGGGSHALEYWLSNGLVMAGPFTEGTLFERFRLV